MLSFSFIFEDVVTRRDIGQGMGGMIGRGLGGAGGAVSGFVLGGPVGALIGSKLGHSLGGQLGKYTGGVVISDPDKAADFEKASHRVGYLAMPLTHPAAAASDVVLGPDVTGFGAGVYNAALENGARRLGYQTAGRVGSFFTPLTGLFRPDVVAKNK